MKVITLFSGIGFQEQGMKNIIPDFDLINYCEYDKIVSKCFSLIHNEPETKNLGDITKLDIPNYYKKLQDENNSDIDLIISSFPCQSFSISGKKEGFNCKKNGNLFHKSFELISTINPKVVIYENVKNITSSKFNVVSEIISKMTSINYKCYHKILNSIDYGIPQNRERWFMVCCKTDDFEFPPKMKLTSCIEDYLVKEQVNRQVGKDMEQYFNDEYKREYKSINGLIKYFDGVENRDFTSGFSSHRIYSVKGCLPTMTTINDCHLWEIKGKLLPIERWRLMGMNDNQYHILKNNNISNTMIDKICGNGIVVNVFEKLFEKVLTFCIF